ncbi:MAG: hypothetical protein JNK53_04010 [Phycisphaerae bacterium]|nr:hypothetical protein [Phycisphaerae bacterium]
MTTPIQARLNGLFGAFVALGLVLSGCETPPKTPADHIEPGSLLEARGSAGATSATNPASASKTQSASAPSGVRRLEANAPNTPAAKPAQPAKPAPTSANDPTASLLDEGAEVDGNVGTARVSQRAQVAAQRPTSESIAATKSASGTAGAAGSVRSADSKPEWAVLLVSFTEADHRAVAENARNAIVQRFPSLQPSYVRTLGSGSAVLIGRFTGPDDPAAQAELRRVKEIGEGVPKPFVRAMLTRLTSAANSGPIGPNDLRTVRQVRPRGTLYTLQVAAWATLGSTELSMSQVKRSAEAYAQQLRTQGYEAYYFHDFGQETSTVTVGVFGPDAYDSRSTLFQPEVEALMRKFPKSLVNGEEVYVEADPRKPGSKRIPQSSRLVEVPKL